MLMALLGGMLAVCQRQAFCAEATSSNLRLSEDLTEASLILAQTKLPLQENVKLATPLVLKLTRQFPESTEDDAKSAVLPEPDRRLRLSNGLAEIAGMPPRSGTAPQESVSVPVPLVLRLARQVLDPAIPDDDDDIPDISRAVLPERERRPREQPVVAVQDGSKTAKASTGSSGKNIFGMKLAPIRWGGYTEDIFRATKNSDGVKNFDHSQRVDLRAASYLWQPWIATVNGNLGFSRGVQGNESGDESKTNSVTGSGDLTVFPQSRFPFSASFSVSDSATSSALSDNSTRSERFSLRQQYRPKTGNATFSATYDNSTISNAVSGDDTVENWRGTYNDQLDKHGLSVEANRTETSRARGKEGLMLNTINATHSYSPGTRWSVSSSAQVSDSELSQFENVLFSKVNTSHSRYVQASSSASWNPKEGLPLNFSGGITFFNAQSEFNGQASESQSMSGNLGASYNYSVTRNLSLGVNGSVMLLETTVDGVSEHQMFTNQAGTATYTGDPLTFGNFSYNWNMNGSASNQTSSYSSIHSLTAGASHNLSRSFRLGSKSNLNMGLNQSLTTRWGGDGAQSSNLSSGGNLGWSIAPSDSLSGSVSLSATDTRTIGSQASDNQFVNLQGNANMRLSIHSSLTGSIGVQWNRQGPYATDQGSPAITSIYTNGSISYQHSRAFGFNNLSYSATANMNMQQQSTARLLGDADAEANPIGWSFDQHLDYRIGRIDIGSTATVTEQAGKKNALLFLHIGRSFGNY